MIYDDLDLDTAAVRLRAKGGHGGHNGMKSIQSHLQGSKTFPRLRIGIGRPKQEGMSIATYVLQDFSKAEKEEIEFAIQDGIDSIRAVFTIGMDKALSGIRVDAKGNQINPQKQENSNKPKGDKAAAVAVNSNNKPATSDNVVGQSNGAVQEAPTALGAALAAAIQKGGDGDKQSS